jgi:hypothetical protein
MPNLLLAPVEQSFEMAGGATSRLSTSPAVSVDEERGACATESTALLPRLVDSRDWRGR